MCPTHSPYALAVLPALVLLIGCGGDKGPTQPPVPVAKKLAFVVQPSAADGAQPIVPPVEVVVQDNLGNTVTAASETVTVALASNPGRVLFGTLAVAATNGIAQFSNLRVDRPGAGYTLMASAPQLTGASSAAFVVTLTFARLTAGRLHTCGVTTAGATYCWGDDTNGQLGITSGFAYTPGLVSSGPTFAAVSAGGYHSCGVTATGSAYCWGANGVGQLGDSTTTQRPSPVLVVGGLTFAALSAGYNHTCGITTVGAAYCWGRNFEGELGDGTRTDQPGPVLVSGGLTFASVSAGVDHSCGVTVAGAAYCWGDNTHGEVGDSSTTFTRPSPELVAGGLTFAAVSAGGNHSCGVIPVGAAYCWGDNSLGQLGDGTDSSRLTPVRVSGGLSFTALIAGGGHTCGLTAAGAAYCWGYNIDGQLGDGTTTPIRSSPVPVSGGLTFAIVSAGGGHTCGITAGGTTYCWGNNSSGQLGNGSSSADSIPVRVVQ